MTVCVHAFSSETRMTSGVERVVSLVAEGAMVFGGVVPFVPQYRVISKTASTAGFSTFLLMYAVRPLLPVFAHDPARARALLKEAGLSEPVAVTMNVRSCFASRSACASTGRSRAPVAVSTSISSRCTGSSIRAE